MQDLTFNQAIGTLTKEDAEKIQSVSQILHAKQLIVEEIYHRHLLSKLVFLFILFSSLYTFISTNFALEKLFPGSSSAFALIFITVVSLSFIWVVATHGCTWRHFGITTRNWQKSIKGALVATGILILISILVKTMVIELGFAKGPIFDPFNLSSNHLNNSYFNCSMIISSYIIFCPLQELIARGILQGILQRTLLINPRKRQMTAILLSNLAFAQVHLHLGLGFAAAAFIAGICWGILYARTKTLIGVSISHILFGVWGQFILGSNFLFH